ncbi:hypothetical protein GS504_01355 [Rhodococcus hoagii]|nr:hypothetical protein [Prescottella equi]
MSTTYTSGSTTIDKDRISGLAEDLESHRATRAHRWGDGNSDRRVCCPLTIAGYILETAGGVASFNMNSYSCTGEFSVTDLNDNALTLYVHVDDETLWNRVDEGAPDPWESLVEILAAHGARGEFNRGNDDGGWRVRIEGGVHRERRIDDLYEGDVVTWAGQLQAVDDGLDEIAFADRPEDAVRALALLARAHHSEFLHSGRIPASRLTEGMDDHAILAEWARLTGCKHRVQPVKL